MDEIIYLILDKLELYWDDPIRVSRKKLPPLSSGEFVKLFIEGNSGPKVAEIWGVGVQTVNRTVADKLVPYIGKANGGGETIGFLLLALVQHKKCSKCNKILPFSEYHKDNHASSLVIATVCKECKSTENKEDYKTYNYLHKKSYDKNYHKILERNQHYKGERSLRCVEWANLEILQSIYKNCPEGMHVDHVLPLKGELVSGLHVPENLQYLPEAENIAKGNRVDLVEYNKMVYDT